MRVAVAVIYNAFQQILIAQRPLHKPHGGLWEFPGGKVEKGEKVEQALIREIKEEVDLNILSYTSLGEISHTYGSKEVYLHLFQVNQFQGEAKCCEGQQNLRWVSIEEFEQYLFPEANWQIIEIIQQTKAITENI